LKQLIFILFLGIFGTTSVLSQKTFQPRPTTFSSNKGLIFDKEITGDLRLQTNGLAVALNIGKIKTYYKTSYYHFEIGEIKHPKEFRNTFDFSPGRDGAGFLFGKRNNLIVLRGGWGHKRYFSEKARKKGLAVGATYEFGPVIGLLKPYQLKLYYTNDPADPSDDLMVIESYSEENREAFTDLKRIRGAGGIFKGWNEVKVRPGIQAKAGLHFDWGAFDELVKAFEVGIMFDGFFQQVPIMIPSENNENRRYFLNLYLTLQFGKRS